MKHQNTQSLPYPSPRAGAGEERNEMKRPNSPPPYDNTRTEETNTKRLRYTLYTKTRF